MVGGAAADLERARPVFAAMGKTITLCGPAGAGHALKALNNYLSAAGLVAMCEALVVGEAFGLDPGTMVDVFNSSTGKSNATEVKGRQFVVSRTFAAGFTTGLMAKDLRTAGEVAQHLKLNMPMLKQAVAYWGDANGKLGGGGRPHRDLPLCRDACGGGRMSPAFTLDSTYIHLRPDESALAMEGGAKFWAGIESRDDLDQGRLMGSVDQSADWNHWERHPAGDEILTLLSGEMDHRARDRRRRAARHAQARRDLHRAQGRLAPRHREGAGPADVRHARRRHRASARSEPSVPRARSDVARLRRQAHGRP